MNFFKKMKAISIVVYMLSLLLACHGIFYSLDVFKLFKLFASSEGNLGYCTDIEKGIIKLKNTHKKLSADEKTIVYSGFWLENSTANFEKMVKKYPKNKVYFAHYAMLQDFYPYLLSSEEYDEIINDKNKLLQFNAKNDMMLDLFQRGEKIDPENALYNYLTAMIYAKKSSVIIEKEGGRDTFKIIDNQEFEKAIQAFKSGLKKKFFTTYSVEYNKLRTQISFNEVVDLKQMLGFMILKNTEHSSLWLSYLAKVLVEEQEHLEKVKKN